MIVCLCYRISHHDIACAVRGGCDSFDALQDYLRVATACGACEECARELHAACLRLHDEAFVRVHVRPKPAPVTVAST